MQLLAIKGNESLLYFATIFYNNAVVQTVKILDVEIISLQNFWSKFCIVQHTEGDLGLLHKALALLNFWSG